MADAGFLLLLASCFLFNAVRAGCTTSFDSVDKVDPHNSQLLGAMWSYFSHNMEVVNYWLATCVLPAETKQYPSRLAATAWHLAHNTSGNIAGFSGTNDNHRLLPLQVQQVGLAAAPQLQGTNGKMLDMLMREGRYDTLQVQVRDLCTPGTACCTELGTACIQASQLDRCSCVPQAVGCLCMLMVTLLRSEQVPEHAAA